MIWLVFCSYPFPRKQWQWRRATSKAKRKEIKRDRKAKRCRSQRSPMNGPDSRRNRENSNMEFGTHLSSKEASALVAFAEASLKLLRDAPPFLQEAREVQQPVRTFFLTSSAQRHLLGKTSALALLQNRIKAISNPPNSHFHRNGRSPHNVSQETTETPAS